MEVYMYTFLLVAAFMAVGVYGDQCIYSDPRSLSFVCNGYTLSLRGLNNGSPGTPFEDVLDGSSYLFQLEAGGLPPKWGGCTWPSDVSAGVASQDGSCTVLANLEPIGAYAGNDGSYLALTMTGPNSTVVANITCDLQAETATFQALGEQPADQFNFALSHCSACPGGCAVQPGFKKCEVQDPLSLNVTCGGNIHYLEQFYNGGPGHPFEGLLEEGPNSLVAFDLFDGGLPSGYGGCEWEEGTAAGVYDLAGSCTPIGPLSSLTWVYREVTDSGDDDDDAAMGDDDGQALDGIVGVVQSKSERLSISLSCSNFIPDSFEITQDVYSYGNHYHFSLYNCAGCPGGCENATTKFTPCAGIDPTTNEITCGTRTLNLTKLTNDTTHGPLSARQGFFEYQFGFGPGGLPSQWAGCTWPPGTLVGRTDAIGTTCDVLATTQASLVWKYLPILTNTSTFGLETEFASYTLIVLPYTCMGETTAEAVQFDEKEMELIINTCMPM